MDQISENWSKIYPYRGQNSNMHLCDAMISAYEATGNEKYLERAYTLAKSVMLGLASQADGLIWENYHIDWTVDWDYEEKDETLAQFRPRGFVPGHLVEWSKILLILDRHMHKNWIVKKAQFLFEYAISHGMDSEYGGWYNILDRQNVRYSNVKSPVTKTDYHPITNCYEVLREILK